jgi:hypothetical protein
MTKADVVERVNLKFATIDCPEVQIQVEDVADDLTIDSMPWRQWLAAMTME